MPEGKDYVTEKELEDLAGEKLDGSGFEDQTPEPEWREDKE